MARLPGPVIAHIGLWSAAIAFAAMLFTKRGERGSERPALLRWLAFAAFCGVLVQAVLGGFRVTEQSGGNANAAMIFRVVHGCFAQFEFGLLVVIASMLNPRSATHPVETAAGIGGVRNLAWVTFAVIFVQLVVAATMRHMGAGLAIPSFPAASASGSWLPPVHNAYTDINFTHTRVLALVVTILVALLAWRVVRMGATARALKQPALLLAGLVGLQIVLGISVIWTLRRQFPTTLHVLNGAIIFATAMLLAVRATCISSGAPQTDAMDLSQNMRKAAA
jgi:cytochrome c oxidase assembly protein subunit 15